MTTPVGWDPIPGAVEVKKSGVTVGSRSAINLIPGTDISLTVTDDAVNDEVDITITSTASGAGGGAAPDTVAGLSAWFDPNDLDASLADQAAVTTWTDKTAAVTVTQETGGVQPTFTADAQNGADLVYFDGGDSLAAASLTDLDIGSGDFTIITVVMIPVVPASDKQHTVLSKDFTRYELYTYNAQPSLYVGGTANPLSWRTRHTPGAWQILVARRSGSAMTGYTGHRLEATATNSAGNTGGSAFNLGRRPGASALFGTMWLGDVAIWKNTAISAADRANVVDYFAAKYGILV